MHTTLKVLDSFARNATESCMEVNAMDELLVFVLVILLGLIGVVIILGVSAVYIIRDMLAELLKKWGD